ncbi:MAG: phosphoglycerate dehydrogenase [Chloroflexi bacterium]|nr:phosphoglycerate dehydrogenase [Chloroflexota bacterium]
MMRVLVADGIAPEGLELLRASAEVDVRTGRPAAELREILGEYDALVVRSQTQVTEDLLAAGLPRLKVVGRAGIGVDNIDVEAATRYGVLVVNAPAANTISAAEHTIALMLALARHIPQAHVSLKAGKWERGKFLGVEVRGKTLGVVGLGKIGTEVARRAQALEMHVVAYDPFVTADYAAKLEVRRLPLDELLRVSDFVTVHTPLTPTTEGLIGARELVLLKPTARLVNCARGGLIDEVALLDALRAGRLAGAALDVFAEEPPRSNPLLEHPAVIATPHLGASTEEAQVRVAVDVAEQVLAVLRDQPVRYAVNLPMRAEAAGVLWPYLALAEKLGGLCVQLIEGQLSSVEVSYSGEIAEHDTSPLKAAVIKGLLEPITEEHINIVNAQLVAKSRRLHITEQKRTDGANGHTSMVGVRAEATGGVVEVAGTIVRGEPHILRIGEYWVDVVPQGYALLSRHRDRPGVIGRVGTLLGQHDINISYMQVGRLAPRGQALMVLGIDEPVSDELRQQILGFPDMQYVKLVRF